MYRDYTRSVESTGKRHPVVKGPRLTDTRTADAELRALQVKIDEGRAQHTEKAATEISFPEWAS